MSIVKPQEFEKSLLRACAQEIIAAFKDEDQVIHAIYGFCVEGGLEIFLSRQAESDAADLAQRMAIKVANSIELYVEAGENYNPKIHSGISGFLLTKKDLLEALGHQRGESSKLDKIRIYLGWTEDHIKHVIRTFEADEKSHITKLPVEMYECEEEELAYPLFDHAQTIGLAYARQFITDKFAFLDAKAGICPCEDVERDIDLAKRDFMQVLSHYACGGDLEKPGHPIHSVAAVPPRGFTN